MSRPPLVPVPSRPPSPPTLLPFSHPPLVQSARRYITKPKDKGTGVVGNHQEILLLLQRSGRLLGFKREWPTFAAGDTFSGKELHQKMANIHQHGEQLLDPQANVSPESSLPSIHRLGNADKLVVCIGQQIRMYETPLDRMQNGLKCESSTEEGFTKVRTLSCERLTTLNTKREPSIACIPPTEHARILCAHQVFCARATSRAC